MEIRNTHFIQNWKYLNMEDDELKLFCLHIKNDHATRTREKDKVKLANQLSR